MGGYLAHDHENVDPHVVYIHNRQIPHITTLILSAPKMTVTAVCLCLLVALPLTHQAEQDEHRDFQYNSLVDNKGKYNFAYDTGHDNDIAHSLHMEYRDDNGIVRGRYGYTDPRGKLRMVEYEAGPDGYKVRGDVGPDLYPHDEKPKPNTESPESIAVNVELSALQMKPNPAPVQMAGWDPVENPIDKPVQPEFYPEDYYQPLDINPFRYNLYPEIVPENADSNQDNNGREDQSISSRESEEYDPRYPRIAYAYPQSDDNSSEGLETTNSENTDGSEYIRESEPLTVYNIDVNPDDIRVASSGEELRKDLEAQSSESEISSLKQAEGSNQTLERVKRKNYYQNPPVVVKYAPEDYHDHSHDGHVHKQVHNHSVEMTYPRQTHDHDAESRYPIRQTHDHAAEYRYPIRQTHDHAAEYKYPSRQTHDHAAEYKYHSRNYAPSRYTHDHDAEKYTTRRIYYRDSHSDRPHEHGSPVRVYGNDRYHRHYDRHLYGRERNSNYPATVRPNHLRYIPSDRYHGKYYYWN